MFVGRYYFVGTMMSKIFFAIVLLTSCFVSKSRLLKGYSQLGHSHTAPRGSASIEKCGGNFKIDAGLVITSPSYPDPYPPYSVYCVWRLQASEWNRLTIHFRTFKTAPNRDIVTIYDGRFSSVLARFSGTLRNVHDVTSRGDYMTVTFLSNNRKQDKGFLATVTVGSDLNVTTTTTTTTTTTAPSTPQGGQCRMQADLEYLSDNLAQGAVATPEECCDMCSSEPMCAVWTWLRWQKMCYLKFASTEQRHTSGAVSGISRNLSLNHCRVERDREYWGNNMNYHSPASSPSECCQLCTNDAKCVVWTWVRSTKTCYPKLRFYQPWKKYNSDAVSGISKMH